MNSLCTKNRSTVHVQQIGFVLIKGTTDAYITFAFNIALVFYFCRERPHQETDWTDSLDSCIYIILCHFIVHGTLSKLSRKAFSHCTNMFRRFVNYNPDHGQKCVRFHEVDAWPPQFYNVSMLSNTILFTPAQSDRTVNWLLKIPSSI